MNAFHSIWTEPYMLKNSKYEISDYDTLIMMISALNWRKYNGEIFLYADEQAIEYLYDHDLLNIWNKTEIISLYDIDPYQFWAAGKLKALSLIESPSVMLDTDFIVWKDISEELHKGDITVIHREEIGDVYPSRNFFIMNSGYCFNCNWDWTVLPCNTALLYIKDDSFRDYYTSEAFRFMKNRIKDEYDFVRSMVFAEQRLLSMCASEKGKQINALLPEYNLDNQDTFTHIWGYKRILQSDADERKQFCRRCLNRIEKDFPEYYQTALKAVKM